MVIKKQVGIFQRIFWYLVFRIYIYPKDLTGWLLWGKGSFEIFDMFYSLNGKLCACGEWACNQCGGRICHLDQDASDVVHNEWLHRHDGLIL